MTWNTTPFRDALIVDTNLALWNYHSGNTDCTAQSWTVWDTTASSTASRWTHQPVWNHQYHSSAQTRGNPSCAAAQPDGWINADVDTLVQTWASASATRGHMGLRAAVDDTRAWKRVNSANNAAHQPKLTVVYNYRPSDGTHQEAGPPFKSYAGVWAVNTTTPTLRDTFTDPDGDHVNGTFQIYDSVTNLPITTPAGDGVVVSAYAASGTPVHVTVPAGQLKDGHTYKFRTSAYDGTHYNTGWSPWRQFVVDTTAPGAPKSITSSTYPENLPGGATGEQGRFDVETGVTDAREVQYRIGPAETDDDGNSGNTSPDGWLSTPTSTGSLYASFNAAPTENGNHQAEVRSVDRADNTGATRIYGFASPRRTDIGRAKKIDIDLPKPNIGATPPAHHDAPQPAWEWVTVQRNGTVTDGKPKVYRSTGPKSRSTVTLTPLAELKRSPEDVAQARRQQRLPSYPDPIIKGAWCDPTLVNIATQMTRTEACLPMQVSYTFTDLSTRPPKAYEQLFDALYMVKVDPDGNKIKTWMQIDPKDWSIPFPQG
ncbi:DNRLRE domain-containing protein [Streptomyces sp. NPDC004838]